MVFGKTRFSVKCSKLNFSGFFFGHSLSSSFLHVCILSVYSDLQVAQYPLVGVEGRDGVSASLELRNEVKIDGEVF